MFAAVSQGAALSQALAAAGDEGTRLRYAQLRGDHAAAVSACDAVLQRAVIRKQQQPLAVGIETVEAGLGALVMPGAALGLSLDLTLRDRFRNVTLDDYMRQLAREGMTMLVVTHEMGFAREVASRVVFMDGGELIESRPAADFFANPEHPRTRAFLDSML